MNLYAVHFTFKQIAVIHLLSFLKHKKNIINLIVDETSFVLTLNKKLLRIWELTTGSLEYLYSLKFCAYGTGLLTSRLFLWGNMVRNLKM